MGPEDLGPDLKHLAEHTQSYAEYNKKLDAEQRKERGSLPPSAPKQPIAPLVLSPARRAEIAKALKTNPNLLSLVPLIAIEPHISPSEFQAFCDYAAKGTK